MHATATTSREHYRTYDASGLYALIKAKMAEDYEQEWCIASLAHALGLERSTVSARMNELRHFGELEYAGKKPSRITGIKSNHYRLRAQNTLI
jgi:hypothetical protein